jgi:hypothetical protein
MATQQIQGGRAKPATIKPSPITPEEFAQIIAEARAERIETDIRDYAQRKSA